MSLKMCPYCGKILDDGRGPLSKQEGEFFCSPEHEALEAALPRKWAAEFGPNVAALALIFHEWSPSLRGVEYSPHMSWLTCIGTALRLDARGVRAALRDRPPQQENTE